MAFVNPALLLAGIGVAAVPILLHLIMQQKPRQLQFPALRFVKERLASNQRRLRVRHWLLLLIRVLGLFLIALAFSQPSTASSRFGSWLTLGGLGLLSILLLFVMVATVLVSKPVNKLFFLIVAVLFAGIVVTMVNLYLNAISDDPATNLSSNQSPVNAILLVDTSPRMLYEAARQTEEEEVAQSETRLQQAQSMADWLIRQLPDESRVAIVDTSDMDPFFSVDVAAAAKKLDALSVDYNANPLPDRLDAILDFLSSDIFSQNADEGMPTEIYVFTDRTLKSWQSKRSKQVQIGMADRPDVSVYLIDVGVEIPTNYQLDNLEVSSETVAAGGRVNILARAFRIGPPGERPLQLVIDRRDPRRPTRRDGRTLYPDEQQVRIAAASFEENGVSEVGFTLQGLSPGIHHGTVRIQGADSLAVDNERYFTLEVRPPWKVLLVRPTKEDETETEVADRLVSVVLAPDDLVESGQASFECTTVDQEVFLNEKLSEYSAVFVLDPKPLNDLQWNGLRKYAEQGGGVAIFLGPNAQSGLAIDPSFNAESAQRVLGGQLGEVWAPGVAFLSQLDFSHPVLGTFKRFETENIWREFPVYQHWGLIESTNAAETRTIARYSTQKPAIVDRQIGDGRVLTITTPVTEPGQVVGRSRWNDLTTGEWWPTAMMIDNMASYLVAAKANRLNYRVGESVVLRQPDELSQKEFLLYTPNPDAEPVDINVTDQELRYRFTDAIGNYRFKAIGSPNLRRGFSVNLARDATDLTKVPDSMLDSAIGEGRYKVAQTRADIIREQSYLREGKKFFPLLMTVFSIIILLEFLMSNRFYRRV